jgi:hypothetical protein
MLESLLSAIVEMLFSLAGHAVLKLLGWENAFEFVAALFGLSCIVIGFAMFLLGYTP